MTFGDPLPGVSDAAMARIVALETAAQDKLAESNGYELRVYGRSFDLAAAFEELEHLLELLDHAATLPQVSLLIKLYVLSWVTLSDVLSNVINEVFDLGYGEQDVELGTLLRNRHIRATSIPRVVKKHTKSVKYDLFARRRNDVAHRGRLIDSELAEVRGRVLSAAVMERVQIVNDAASADALAREVTFDIGVDRQIRALITHKRSEFAEHLAATRVMLAELAPVLIERIRTQLK
jgi:hypothetical protein